jgi:nucleotide-binding universal stress UspA family protein
MMKLRRILVPISDDAAAEEGLKLACFLARHSKAKIYVVYIIEVKRSLPLDAQLPGDTLRAESVLTRAEEIAADEDCEVETDLLQARDVGHAIIDEAQERAVDMIVMGVGYKKRFGFYHVSDTISRVVREAPCRVLLLQETPDGKVKQ